MFGSVTMITWFDKNLTQVHKRNCFVVKSLGVNMLMLALYSFLMPGITEN